ncbi:MAG: ribbon-helix-helix protein, CopG family [Vulcanimicrobiaceae bacterium]
MKLARSMRRITVTLSRSLINRLTSLREKYRVSVSAIVEIALVDYFERNDEVALAQRLGEGDTGLRRR